jgi:hypothetical protein
MWKENRNPRDKETIRQYQRVFLLALADRLNSLPFREALGSAIQASDTPSAVVTKRKNPIPRP